MSRLRISVVIPTYNRANIVGETLEAVFTQTRPPHEMIVVDDGSTDGTPAALRAFGNRVSVIRIANSGDMVARNVGLRAASGRLVAFCDDDDLWLPEFLETMEAQWDAEPNLSVCYSNFRILEDGALRDRAKFDDAPPSYWENLRAIGADAGVFDTNVVELLVAFQPFFPSCMMVDRMKFLAAGGWDEGVSRMVGCDFATALRAAALSPMGVVQRPLVSIRKHTSNISGNTEKMNLGDAKVLEHVLRTRPELAPLRSVIQRSVAKRRIEAMDSAFSRRDFSSVRAVYGLLPASDKPLKQKLKRAISALPHALALLASGVVS
jgi:glycosyltransferase involved in cell wall biosynthesis